jgi:hypothetical protein
VKIYDVQQGTPEWFELRLGVPTASQFHRILTPKTLKIAAASDEYIHELVADHFRSEPAPSVPMNHAMEHGIQTEAEARRWYAMETDCDVTQVGFITNEEGTLGCSPDGLVGADGGLELKCPQPNTQVRYLLEGGLPPEYRCQVHGSLIVTGRHWWDFLSYCQGLPPLLVRVKPDLFTDALNHALTQFLERYQLALARIKELQ